MKRTINRLRSQAAGSFRDSTNRLRARGKPKIFCIGRNKTGTTSLAHTFRDLGFTVGNQRTGEILYDTHYWRGEFTPIIEYCKSAQVFQDVPFSVGDTFRHLDLAFPDAKFILSIRSSPEVWFDSLIRFHNKIFGNGQVPTAQQLREADYVRRGWAYDNLKRLYHTTDEDLYARNTLISHYMAYNQSVVDHFRDRPNQLLVIDLAANGSWESFTDFLALDGTDLTGFPHENRT